MTRAINKAIALNSLMAVTRDLRSIARPAHGWLRAVREALRLPRAAVARTLNVSASAVQDYEKAEKTDTITLGTFRRVAAALDCELVIALVPRNGRTFADLAAALDPEITHLKATEHSMALESQGSDDLARQIKERLGQ